MKKLLFCLAIPIIGINLSQAQNLLTNGGFDDIEGPLVARTADEWGMWSGNGGTAEVIDGVVNVSPIESPDNWNMQVEQYQVILENEKTYVVTFDAWADADRIIALTIEDPSNGYALLGTTDDEGATDIDGVMRSKWNIDITTEQVTYSRTLTIDQVVDNTIVKFAFLLAQTADKVYIDNVSLVEEGGGVTVKTNEAKNTVIYPNPTKNLLNIQSSKNYSEAHILNLLGQKVLNANNTSKFIDVSSLHSGIYILKLTDSDQQVESLKFQKN